MEVALARGFGDGRGPGGGAAHGGAGVSGVSGRRGHAAGGWPRELEELATALDPRGSRARIGRRLMLHVRVARLSAAFRTLDMLAPDLPEAARRIADAGGAPDRGGAPA